MKEEMIFIEILKIQHLIFCDKFLMQLQTKKIKKKNQYKKQKKKNNFKMIKREVDQVKKYWEKTLPLILQAKDLGPIILIHNKENNPQMETIQQLKEMIILEKMVEGYITHSQYNKNKKVKLF